MRAALVLLLVAACGSVTSGGADGAGGAGGATAGSAGTSSDAGQEQTPTDTGSTAGSSGNSGNGGGGGGAGCGQWQNGSQPYCSSCRCANGNQGAGCCVCGVLPCCDPSCQS